MNLEQTCRDMLDQKQSILANFQLFVIILAYFQGFSIILAHLQLGFEVQEAHMSLSCCPSLGSWSLLIEVILLFFISSCLLATSHTSHYTLTSFTLMMSSTSRTFVVTLHTHEDQRHELVVRQQQLYCQHNRYNQDMMI